MCEIAKIKREIAVKLSRLSYDALLEVEDMIRFEKRSRPEELLF